MQTPNLGVITDVDDDVDIFFGDDLHQAAQEFRRSGSARQNGVIRSGHLINVGPTGLPTLGMLLRFLLRPLGLALRGSVI